MNGAGVFPGDCFPFTPQAGHRAEEEPKDAYAPSHASEKRRHLMGKVLIGLAGVAVAILTLRSGMSKLFQPSEVKAIAKRLRGERFSKIDEIVAECENALKKAELSGDKEQLKNARNMTRRYEKRLRQHSDTEHLADRLGELRKVNKSSNGNFGEKLDNIGAQFRNNKPVVTSETQAEIRRLDKMFSNDKTYFGKAKHHLEQYRATGDRAHLEALRKHLHEDEAICSVKSKQKTPERLQSLLNNHQDELPKYVTKYRDLLNEFDNYSALEQAAESNAPKFYQNRLREKASDFIMEKNASNLAIKNTLKESLWNGHNISNTTSLEELAQKRELLKADLQSRSDRHLALSNAIKSDRDQTAYAQLAKDEVLDPKMKSYYEDLAKKTPDEIKEIQQDHIRKSTEYQKIHDEIDAFFDGLKNDQQQAIKNAKADLSTLRAQKLNTLLSDYDAIEPVAKKKRNFFGKRLF